MRCDHFSLGTTPRQRRYNVDVISHTADMYKFGTEVTADSRKVCMHARPHG